jgi:hypothetical protein
MHEKYQRNAHNIKKVIDLSKKRTAFLVQSIGYNSQNWFYNKKVQINLLKRLKPGLFPHSIILFINPDQKSQNQNDRCQENGKVLRLKYVKGIFSNFATFCE